MELMCIQSEVVWKFNKKELIKDEGHEEQWMARQHHDYQREGNPVGYYVPGMECKTDSGNTLILCHEDIYNKRISDKRLLDDVFVEVDWEGNIVWEWHVSQHFNELGFSEAAKNVLFRNPNNHPNNQGIAIRQALCRTNQLAVEFGIRYQIHHTLTANQMSSVFPNNFQSDRVNFNHSGIITFVCFAAVFTHTVRQSITSPTTVIKH